MTRLNSQFLFCFLLFSLLFTNQIASQIGYQLVEGATSRAIGGAGVTVQGAQAIFQNPAGLITTTDRTLVITSETRYGLKDLKPIAIATVFPTQSGVLGMTYQSFHFDNYRESKIGMAYSRRMGANFNVGIQLDYLRLRISEYGAVNLVTFELGSNVLIIKDLVLSAYVFNPLAIRINETEERTPSVFRLGLAYQLNAKVLLCLETEKDIFFKPSFKFGMAYQVAESLAIRCGFSTSPNVFSLGMGYKIAKQFTIDLALSHHFFLGLTPAVNVTYSIPKEKR